MRNRLFLPATLVLLLLTAQAQATTFSLSAVIDGAQANAGSGTGSPGTGSAAITYDDVTNLLSWNITWSGLSGPVTVAHFHGAALPNANAGVQVNFGAISGETGPSAAPVIAEGTTPSEATIAAEASGSSENCRKKTAQFAAIRRIVTKGKVPVGMSSRRGIIAGEGPPQPSLF